MDLTPLEESDLKSRWRQRAVWLVLALLRFGGAEDIVSRLSGWEAELAALATTAEGQKLLQALLRYLLLRRGEPVRGNLTHRLKERAVHEAIRTIADDLRDEGRAEGRVEATRALLKRLLQRKFGRLPEPTLVRLEAADEARLTELGERLLDATVLDELFPDGE